MDLGLIESFIGKIELFKDLDEEERKELCGSVEVKTYAPDELLFQENSARRHLFIIYEGEVELFKKSPDKCQVIL